MSDPLSLTDELADFRRLLAVPERELPALRGLFDGAELGRIARAPGRLDVMGGIADYSGSLVLELPIREAAWVAVATHAEPLVRIATVDKGARQARSFEAPIAAFSEGVLAEYESACAYFRADPARRWAAYIAGTLLVLMRERGLRPTRGLRILLASDVPEGKGVSSSAAIEVAAMQAVAATFGLQLDEVELAELCQRVENRVVGAPCGLMDQMTASCGREDKLLELLCQPSRIQGQLTVPEDIEFFGIDSGVRHQVTGADYGQVRVAAFMGYRMLADVCGLPATVLEAGRVRIDDTRYGGYLANVTPSEYARRFRNILPAALDGRAFLDRYGGSTDDVTRIESDRSYPVASATEHAIFEHFRVRTFAELLSATPRNLRRLEQLAELMYQSHASYSACGLGCHHTDLLVELVQRAPRETGLLGAKITGGGSGGTVAVLARAGARAAVQRVADEYGTETGHSPYVFAGSSPGAAEYGSHSFDS
ncbi:MAG TPA: galactokinase family protein [Polyangiaceae bacterium]|jgi:L-arabinokinase